jgi:uncharacterized membrane protein
MALLQPGNLTRPWHPALPGEAALTYFAAAFFTFGLVADWAYVQTTILMWRDFASWVLFAGLICGAVAVLLWLIALAVYRHPTDWIRVTLNGLVLVAAFINSLVHAGDGWVAIMPWGIGLSLLTCALMLISGTRRHLAVRPILRR